jgi:PAS domain S-box-containing protein
VQRLLEGEQSARAAAERAGERIAFLAEASDALAQSLDHEETLARFARLVVQRIADWAIVYALDGDGNLVRDLVVGANPEDEAKAQPLVRRRPPVHRSNGFARVLAGESVLLADLTDDVVARQMGDDVDAIGTWHEVGICSSLIVPLEARGRVIGALGMMSSNPARRFDEEDLGLAQELGRRVAFAVENAKLYEQAQREIERRRRIEDALRRSEEQYRMLFETNPNPMWIFDIETLRFLAVNETALETYGYTREEFLSLRSVDIRPVDDVERHLASIREAQSTRGIAKAGVFRHNRKDGTLLHVEITAQPLEFEGRPAQVVLAVDVTERIEAEEALRESEGRYRELVENASELIATVDVDSRFTSVNAAFAKSLGYTREELLGKRLRDLVPPEQHERLEAARFSKYEGDGAPTTYEHDFIGKDGRRVTVEVATQVVHEAGRPVGVQAICRDITGRSVAERALRAAEARYRMLVEGLPLVTFVHAAGGNEPVTYISPQVERLLGYPQEDWLTRADLFWELMHPEDADRLREATASHDSFNRFRMRAKDGREVWLHGERQVVRDDDGKPLYVQGFWLDVTDHHRAETALRESQELYRLVVENARDLIGIFDAEGRFLFASPSHETVLGYEPGELIGREGSSFRHPDDPATISAVVWDPPSAVTGMPVRMRLRHREGHWVEVESFAVPILNEDGSLRAIVGSGRDLTDRLRADELAEQLRQAQKMEAIGRLAGGVAHDFNNLLTVIVGYWDLARIRTDVPSIHEAIEQVSMAARTASGLTQQLLAFSRQQVIQPRAIDLGALVWGTRVLVDRLVGEDVTVELSIGSNLPPISADPNQIEQVLLNLAANASEAMPDGGRVSIEARTLDLDEAAAAEVVGLEPGSYVLLSVADTGIGMDEETRSRIFEPFFTTKEDGTGLGLATVHGIVTQSDGLIWVESAPGQGTTFTLVFPAGGERPQAAVVVAEESVAGDLGGTQTVLVVEDEEAVRELAAEVLTGHGYTVLAAATGEDALALVAERTRPLDLVLSDVMLPGMKGPTLVEELRKLHPEARTIFISGYAPALISERGVQADVPFLPKPFTATALAAKVREVLSDCVVQLPTGRMRPDATRSRAVRAAGA